MPIVIGVVVLFIIGTGVAFFLSSSEETSIAEVNNAVFVNDDSTVINQENEAQESEEKTVQTETVLKIRPEDIEDEVSEVNTVLTEREIDTIFANGSYTANASYFTPRRVQHDMVVTLEVENDIVVDASITYDGGAAETPNHTRFDEAYSAEVVGVRLTDITLSRTGGASLTSEAFNEAIQIIKADATS